MTPDTDHSMKILAIANQKGGVGKTTSAINLSAFLAAAGHPTLLVDLDPQCNATSGLGFDPVEEPDLVDLLLDPELDAKLIPHPSIPGFHLLTGSPDLVGSEKLLAPLPNPVQAIQNLIGRIAPRIEGLRFVVLDCPPSLNLLTLGALTAAHHLLIPVQAEFWALEGLTDMLQSFEFARTHTNPGLNLLGLFLTMTDVRTNLSREVEAELRKHYGPKVFEASIPRNVRLSEAPSHGLPILLYDLHSRGGKAYMELTREVLQKI